MCREGERERRRGRREGPASARCVDQLGASPLLCAVPPAKEMSSIESFERAIRIIIDDEQRVRTSHTPELHTDLHCTNNPRPASCDCLLPLLLHIGEGGAPHRQEPEEPDTAMVSKKRGGGSGKWQKKKRTRERAGHAPPNPHTFSSLCSRTSSSLPFTSLTATDARRVVHVGESSKHGVLCSGFARFIRRGSGFARRAAASRCAWGRGRPTRRASHTQTQTPQSQHKTNNPNHNDSCRSSLGTT